MGKSAKVQTKGSYPRQVPAAKSGYLHSKFVDHKLAGVNPLKKQFEPTEASPVRQHFKMAGGCD